MTYVHSMVSLAAFLCCSGLSPEIRAIAWRRVFAQGVWCFLRLESDFLFKPTAADSGWIYLCTVLAVNCLAADFGSVSVVVIEARNDHPNRPPDDR
ncbi:hypothetical protein BDV59DRAFT_11952 [Aspergillus ambiguus]|uniref:uncharacterized protein n=1 Tax=Aspergillus ambiguus TaxID=176160 RepID=UPI003CCC9ACA